MADLMLEIEAGDIKRIAADLKQVKAALAFYAEHGAGCQLTHLEGDRHRQALAHDGGALAREAINKMEPCRSVLLRG